MCNVKVSRTFSYFLEGGGGGGTGRGLDIFFVTAFLFFWARKIIRSGIRIKNEKLFLARLGVHLRPREKKGGGSQEL